MNSVKAKEIRRVLKEREEKIKQLRYVVRKLPKTLTNHYFFGDSIEVALDWEAKDKNGDVLLPVTEITSVEQKLAFFRKELREAFGTWSDHVSGMSIYDEHVSVTYRSTNKELPVYFELSYPRDGFEKTGLLKPGCKIVTKRIDPTPAREYVTIECEV